MCQNGRMEMHGAVLARPIGDLLRRTCCAKDRASDRRAHEAVAKPKAGARTRPRTVRRADHKWTFSGEYSRARLERNPLPMTILTRILFFS